MIFKLVKPDVVKVPVEVTPPEGKTAKIKLSVRYLSVTEIKELLVELTEDDSIQDADMAQRLLVGWEGIADEEGDPIPFSASALEDAMDIPYFHDAVAEALLDHLIRGRGKNFAPPASNGRRQPRK